MPPRSPTSSSSTAQAGIDPARRRMDSSKQNGAPHPKRPRAGVSGTSRALSRFNLSWRGLPAKEQVTFAFRMFGEHCARNQIRTLLIVSVVMTNLFYPALSIYLENRMPYLNPPTSSNRAESQALHNDRPSQIRDVVQKENPLSLLRTPFLDSFFPYPPPLLPRLDWAGLWGTDIGLHGDWGGARARLMEGIYSEDDGQLVMKRIAWADVEDVLDRPTGKSHPWRPMDDQIVSKVREMAESWEDLHGYGEGCVRQLVSNDQGTHLTGPCAIVSPHLESSNTIPISQLSFVMRALDRPPALELGFASPRANKMYHSVAVFMRVPKSTADTWDDRWNEAMEAVAVELKAEIFLEPRRQGARSDVLSFMTVMTTDNSTSEELRVQNTRNTATRQEHKTITRLIVLFYVLLVILLGSNVTSATQVHSRYGLAITGIVQTCCSAIMSFSVLSLCGWTPTSSGEAGNLPTYMLPFVVVVVGAENMATLTKAVFSIPFTYSVPGRIGRGLSKVGISIAVTSLSDLGILAGVALCVNLRPVRDFCLFAGVVIITDWFMLHTFFLTVLSIDAQRLELADVLANPDGVSPRAKAASRQGRKPRESILRRLTRARKSKSGSLLIILFSLATIYYVTERQPSDSIPGLYGYKPSNTLTPFLTPTPFVTTSQSLTTFSTSEKLWRALNPSGYPSLRVYAPLANVMVLPHLGHRFTPADVRKISVRKSRVRFPRVKPLCHLFKVVILPQLLTVTALWALVSYLLKDASFLNAQRDRLGRGDNGHSEPDENEPSGKDTSSNMDVHLLPTTHSADIEIVGCSLNGKVVVTVGSDDIICLWRFDKDPSSGTREILKASGPAGEYHYVVAAVTCEIVHLVTRGGLLQTWRMSESDTTMAEGSHQLDIGNARVVNIELLGQESRSSSIASLTDHTSPSSSLLIGLSDGSIIKFSAASGDVRQLVPACSSPPLRLYFQREAHGSISVLVAATDTTTLYQISEERLDQLTLETGNITAFARNPQAIALGTKDGRVDLWDNEGNLIATLPTSSKASDPPTIRKLAVVSPSVSQCTTCGHKSTKSLFILSATLEQIQVYQLLPKGTHPCRCTRRDSSADFSPSKLAPPPPPISRPLGSGSSPKRSSIPLAQGLNGLGAVRDHTRRPSNTSRRSDDVLVGLLGPPNGLAVEDSGEMDFHLFGPIPTPTGGESWSVIGETVVGLRRKGNAIDESGWSVWSLDLAAPWNGQKLLVDSTPFSHLVREPISPETDAGGTSMKIQRHERMLSLDGRSSFPSTSRQSVVPTVAPLAFVEVRPWVNVGDLVMLGLGNRLAVFHMAEVRKKTTFANQGTGEVPLPRSRPRREINSDK